MTIRQHDSMTNLFAPVYRKSLLFWSTLFLFLVAAPQFSLLGAQEHESPGPTLSVYGAARTISGSCHILDTGYERIMLDCGTFMERGLEKRNNSFPFDPASAQILLLSHAHIDHAGRIPLLFNRGFSGMVLCAPATKELSRIMLEIQVRIAEDTGRMPLYTSYDIQRAIDNFTEQPYNTPFLLPSGTEITPINAQHILGSAMFIIRFGPPEKRESVLFTGDFGNAYNNVLLPRLDFPAIDYLITESTYGGKVRTGYEEERNSFFRMIRETIDDGGVVLIPSFVLARTQKVVGMIYHGMREGQIPKSLDVYIHSVSASKITKIYAEHPEQLAEEYRGGIYGGESPFTMENLHLDRTFTEINTPAIVIAPSSDLSKGAITTYVENYIDKPSTRICFVSTYQEPGSVGDKLVKGASEIELNGRFLPVRAKVSVIASFSGHGDQQQITDWLKKFPGFKRVFVVHGSVDSTSALADHIHKTFSWPTTIPRFNRTYDLRTGRLVARKSGTAPSSSSSAASSSSSSPATTEKSGSSEGDEQDDLPAGRVVDEEGSND